MFSKKNIVVTIGQLGTIIVFHEQKSIVKRLFVEELNDVSKSEILKNFAKDTKSNIDIVLDTIDQSFTHKAYPYIRNSDLKTIVKRDLAASYSSTNSLNSYVMQRVIDPKNKKKRKKECLLISATLDEKILAWIDFLSALPNYLTGIYLLPVETYNFISRYKKLTLKKVKPRKGHNEIKKEQFHCLMIQTKVSGFRQVILSDYGIIFSRVLNYDLNDSDFVENYEQDIYSAYQYLKRSDDHIHLSDIKIINILSPKIIQKVKNIHNLDLDISNYTPMDLAKKFGFNNILKRKSTTADLFFSRLFFRTKKPILRLANTKINFMKKLYLTSVVTYNINLFLFTVLCLISVLAIYSRINLYNVIEEASNNKFKVQKRLLKLQNTSFNIKDDEQVDIEKAVEFGKIHEALSSVESDPVTLYKELSFISDFNVIIKSFNYDLANYDHLKPKRKFKFDFGFVGNILNETGDIDDLFIEFDNLTAEAKKIFKDYDVKYKELPRNIDFNKKYFNFPIEFSITSNNKNNKTQDRQ